MAMVLLGNDVVDGAISFASGSVFAVRASVFITEFIAAMFAFRLNAFSRRFFFWECFPCPGPGILNVIY